MLEVYIMKYISCKQYESALFNMDSLRTKLLNERDDAFMGGDEQKYETICSRVDEVETLLGKMYMNNIRRNDWAKIQELVNERKMQRYITCLNSGMDERIAAGSFED